MTTKAPDPRKLARAKKAGEAAPSKTDFAMEIAGVQYPIRFGELSALDAGALRRSTGMTISELQQILGGTSVDIDCVAALVWLSRRQSGETGLDYNEVAGSITYAALMESPPVLIEADAVEEDPDSPEA